MMRVESLPFEQALSVEATRTAENLVRTALYGYRHRGLYARRLELWRRASPRSSFLFLKFEDTTDPTRSQEMADRIHGFLGVASRTVQAMPREGRDAPPEWLIGEDAILAATPGGMLRASSPSTALRAFAIRARSLSAEPPPRERMMELNESLWGTDIARLEAMTGVDLADWRA